MHRPQPSTEAMSFADVDAISCCLNGSAVLHPPFLPRLFTIWCNQPDTLKRPVAAPDCDVFAQHYVDANIRVVGISIVLCNTSYSFAATGRRSLAQRWHMSV